MAPRVKVMVSAASFRESSLVAMVTVCEVEPAPLAGKVTDSVPGVV